MGGWVDHGEPNAEAMEVKAIFFTALIKADGAKTDCPNLLCAKKADDDIHGVVNFGHPQPGTNAQSDPQDSGHRLRLAAKIKRRHPRHRHHKAQIPVFDGLSIDGHVLP